MDTVELPYCMARPIDDRRTLVDWWISSNCWLVGDQSFIYILRLPPMPSSSFLTWLWSHLCQTHKIGWIITLPGMWLGLFMAIEGLMGLRSPEQATMNRKWEAGRYSPLGYLPPDEIPPSNVLGEFLSAEQTLLWFALSFGASAVQHSAYQCEAVGILAQSIWPGLPSLLLSLLWACTTQMFYHLNPLLRLYFLLRFLDWQFLLEVS